MALYQASNITPSSLAGLGNGVVSALDDISITWQVNGNSVMTGFDIAFYRVNDDGTTTPIQQHLTDTGLTVYPTDTEGNPTFYTYAISNSWANFLGLTNGNTYQFYITQNWDGGSVTQIAPTAFITRRAPSLSLATIGTNGVVNSVTTTIRANYSQAQGDTITWVRWELAEVSESGEITVIQDTGEINTIQTTFVADGLRTGSTYAVRCTVETQNGVQVATNNGDWTQFSVQYDTLPFSGDLVAIPSEKYNELRWQAYNLLTDIQGQCVPENNYTVGEAGQLQINNGYIEWNSVNGEPMSFAAPCSVAFGVAGSNVSDGVYLQVNDTYSVQFENAGQLHDAKIARGTYSDGKDTQTITFTRPLASASVANKPKGTSVTFSVAPNGLSLTYTITSALVPVGTYFINFSLTYRENVYNAKLYATSQPEPVAELTDIWQDGKNFILGACLTPTRFYAGSKSVAIESTIESVTSLKLYAGAYAWLAVVQNGNPIYIRPNWQDSATKLLATFDLANKDSADYLQAGQKGDVAIRSDIYRGVNGGKLQRLISLPTNEGKQCLLRDYNITAGNTYEYWLFAVNTNSQQYFSATFFPVQDSETPSYITRCKQPFYLLIEAEPDSQNRNVYNVVKTWKFGNNINAGVVTNNNSPSWLTNFTGYDLKQPSVQRGRSGALQALLSNVSNGKYADTIEQMDELWEASLSLNAFFLKDIKGSLYKVAISAPITQTINNLSVLQEVTISLEWREVGTAQNAVIIQSTSNATTTEIETLSV